VDLPLYAHVLWRFRWLVLLGLLLGAGLAFLSVARVTAGEDGFRVTYSQSETWASSSTLFVTQRGFPEGRSIVDTESAEPIEQVGRLGLRFADPARFSSLALLYAHLADSDDVRAIMLRSGPIHGEVKAAPILASENTFADALPLIEVAAFADSGRGARRLGTRATRAFRAYLAREQQRNGISAEDRVVVVVVKAANKAKLVKGRSFTPPVVVFLTTLIACFALAFILENLRPRVRAPAADRASPTEQPGRQIA
jgi:hypothetical protein